MNTQAYPQAPSVPQANYAAPRGQHPLVLGAAVAVTAFSLAGIAALLGWLPSHTPAAAPVAAQQLAAAQPTAPVQAPAAVQPATVTDAKGATISLPPGATVNINNHTTHKTVSPQPVKPAPAQPTASYAPPPPPVVSSTPSYPVAGNTYPASYPAPSYCRDCGVIESIRQLPQQNESSGLGALAGGVLGAALGHNVGGGRGRDIATVAGMIGGAMAGNSIERSSRNGPSAQVVVRMEDGSTRVIPMDAGRLQIGDRVRLSNGGLYPI